MTVRLVPLEAQQRDLPGFSHFENCRECLGRLGCPKSIPVNITHDFALAGARTTEAISVVARVSKYREVLVLDACVP